MPAAPRVGAGALQGPLRHLGDGCKPQHPKYLENELLGLHDPLICGHFNPKALEYVLFGLVDVQGKLIRRSALG